MLTLNSSHFMSIANNISSLGSQLSASNYRLTTGKRVNTAADDPGAMIASNYLSSQIAQIDAVISNGSRIGSIAQTADGSLSEISTLIETIQSRVVLAASDSTTEDERAAYQNEIDQAVESIDRLVTTTSYNGKKLLDGDLAYSTGSIDTSKILDLRVNSASIDSSTITVNAVTNSAEKAFLSVAYADASPATDLTMTVVGNLGSVEYNFAAGTSRGLIANTINADAATHGVNATYTGTAIEFESAQAGADQFVRFNVTQGSYPTESGAAQDYGRDAGVTVNGMAATVSGRDVYFNTGSVSGSFSITSAFQTTPGSTSFTITGGGSGYRLDGTSSGRIDFGQDSLQSSTLGSNTLGYLSSLVSGGTNALSSGNYETAGDIAEKALNQVSASQARWGALKSYTVDSTVNSLSKAKTAMTSAKSNLIDLDYAAESAYNNRLQVLTDIGAQVMAAMNVNAQNVLSLLQPIF